MILIQEEKMAVFPSAMSDIKGLIKTLEHKVGELRKMQPDWSRLNQLETVVIPKTEKEQQDLEAKSSQEASRAAELHEQVQDLRKKDQVCYVSGTCQSQQQSQSQSQSRLMMKISFSTVEADFKKLIHIKGYLCE